MRVVLVVGLLFTFVATNVQAAAAVTFSLQGKSTDNNGYGVAHTKQDIYASVLLSQGTLNKEGHINDVTLPFATLSQYPSREDANQAYGGLKTPLFLDPTTGTAGAEFSAEVKALYANGYLVVHPPNTGQNQDMNESNTVVLWLGNIGATVYDALTGIMGWMEKIVKDFNIPVLFGIGSGALPSMNDTSATTAGHKVGWLESTAGSFLQAVGINKGTTALVVTIIISVLVIAFGLSVVMALVSRNRKKGFARSGLVGLRILVALLTIPVAISVGAITSGLGNAFDGASADILNSVSSGAYIDTLSWAATNNLYTGGANLNNPDAATKIINQTYAGSTTGTYSDARSLFANILNQKQIDVQDYMTAITSRSSGSAGGATTTATKGVPTAGTVAGFTDSFDISTSPQAGGKGGTISGSTDGSNGKTLTKTIVMPDQMVFISGDQSNQSALASSETTLTSTVSDVAYLLYGDQHTIPNYDPSTATDEQKANAVVDSSQNVYTVTPLSTKNPSQWIYGGIAATQQSDSQSSVLSYTGRASSPQAFNPVTGTSATPTDSNYAVLNANARGVALWNRFAGTNVGPNSPSGFSTQSVAFLLQSTPDNPQAPTALHYQGYNSLPTKAGQAKGQAPNGATFDRYTIPATSAAARSAKIASLAIMFCVAAITALLVLIALLKAPLIHGIIGGIVGLAKSFTGNFGGLFAMTIYTLGLWLVFIVARIAIMFGLIVGAAIENVFGAQQFLGATATASTAAQSGNFFTNMWTSVTSFVAGATNPAAAVTQAATSRVYSGVGESILIIVVVLIIGLILWMPVKNITGIGRSRTVRVNRLTRTPEMNTTSDAKASLVQIPIYMLFALIESAVDASYALASRVFTSAGTSPVAAVAGDAYGKMSSRSVRDMTGDTFGAATGTTRLAKDFHGVKNIVTGEDKKELDKEKKEEKERRGSTTGKTTKATEIPDVGDKESPEDKKPKEDRDADDLKDTAKETAEGAAKGVAAGGPQGAAAGAAGGAAGSLTDGGDSTKHGVDAGTKDGAAETPAKDSAAPKIAKPADEGDSAKGISATDNAPTTTPIETVGVTKPKEQPQQQGSVTKTEEVRTIKEHREERKNATASGELEAAGDTKVARALENLLELGKQNAEKKERGAKDIKTALEDTTTKKELGAKDIKTALENTTTEHKRKDL